MQHLEPKIEKKVLVVALFCPEIPKTKHVVGVCHQMVSLQAVALLFCASSTFFFLFSFSLSLSSAECLLTGWHAALRTTLTFATRRAGYERGYHKRRVTKPHCSAGPPPVLVPVHFWCKAAPRVLQLAPKQQFSKLNTEKVLCLSGSGLTSSFSSKCHHLSFFWLPVSNAPLQTWDQSLDFPRLSPTHDRVLLSKPAI